MKPAGLMVGSSPAREKLPAPLGLARFLGSSRSRGRSSGSSGVARSSPIFVSRSRSVGRASAAAGGTAAEAGEPSSPKVTCIGQVRIRNKSKRPISPSPSSKLKRAPSRKASRGAPPSLMPCRCLQKGWIWSIFPARKKPKGGTGCGARRSKWRRWAWLSFRSGGSGGSGRSAYREQKPEMDRPPFPELFILTGGESDRNRDDYEEDVREEEEASKQEKETRVFVQSAAAEVTTPPKNALLLMRCRSAPHNRASALATARFAVSPLSELDLLATEQKKDANSEDVSEKGVEKEAETEKKRKLSNATSNDGRETTEPAAAEAGEDDEDEEEDEAMRSESQRPLVLTRSKSEPARSAAEKLAVAPEPDEASSYCFWNSGGSGRRQQQQQRRTGLHHEEGGPRDTAQS